MIQHTAFLIECGTYYAQATPAWQAVLPALPATWMVRESKYTSPAAFSCCCFCICKPKVLV